MSPEVYTLNFVASLWVTCLTTLGISLFVAYKGRGILAGKRFIISEGSYLFVLESLRHAIRRGARIYGELRGYGSTCDAYHMSIPNPTGEYTAQAIRDALVDAGLKPSDIQYFSAYGNSTKVNDSYETRVIKKVFGKHANKLAISSTKSMLGHPIGASGACSLAAVLMAIHDGWIHPTINQEIPDPECDLDYVANYARRGNVDAAVCNTLAFGSKNSALVVSKFEPSNGSSKRRQLVRRIKKASLERKPLQIPKSASTTESIIVNSQLEDVYRAAEEYPRFVRGFRRTRMISRSEKTMVFEITSSLLGLPVTWRGKGLKTPHRQIKFVQLEGLLKGMRAIWYFEGFPDVTRVTIVTTLKSGLPVIGKLIERILVQKVRATTKGILMDLKRATEERIPLSGKKS